MEISITVTSDCNLSCRYCYQGVHNSHSVITDKTINELVDFIERKLEQFNDSSLHAVFIGGEALLAYKQIILIVKKFNECLPNVKKIYYLTTNGTVVNKEIIGLLKKNNFQVTVSVDGDEESHNRNRVDRFNRGTYETVIKGIYQFKMNEIDVTARMTITPDNVSRMFDGIVSLYNKGITKISPVCDYLVEWEQEAIDMLIKNYKKLGKWYLHNIENISLACFDGRFHSLLTRKGKFCNAGIGPHYTIAVDGTVYPCNYVTDDSKFLLGDLKFIKSAEEINKEILKYYSKDNNKCYICEVKTFCHGRKCTFLNWKTSGDISIVSSILCTHEIFMYQFLQELLIDISAVNPNILKPLLEYIEEETIGNDTYKKIKDKLWNMMLY